MSNPSLIEWLASGQRKCACPDVRLTVSRWELKREWPWSSNPIRNLILSVQRGVRYCKHPQRGWQAECSQCSRLYLVASNRPELRRQIQAAGLEEAP
jgi:hypothetical protein